MAQFDRKSNALVGPKGSLPVPVDDEITTKLSMLIEGECDGLGPIKAARKFGFSRQRYFQLRKTFAELGAEALQSDKRGPKTQYRRTAEAVRQVIRHRFLDPQASAEVIAQKLTQGGQEISIRSVQRIIGEFGLQKKLYQCRPREERTIETQRTTRRTRTERCDPASLERGVRQLLADKVSGNLLGLWLLIPEHLRLGTWDLLCGWNGQVAQDNGAVEPRLAMQLVHEAALCSTGIRQKRALSQRGFELANGLAFVASDMAIHNLLAARTVADAQRLQVALGRIRRVSGDYAGKLLAIDPHRMPSSSKRQTRRIVEKAGTKARKMMPTFFALDADTHQPVCFITATPACTATTAAIELLGLSAEILAPQPGACLVMADMEHVTAELFHHVQQHTPFDLLTPMKNQHALQQQLRAIAPDQFTRRWAGFATCKQPYRMAQRNADDLFQLVQRSGERPDEHRFNAFLCTSDRQEADTLTQDYPKRWHVEEFFNAHQSLGWNRGGTLNLNIRYGQMTMALLAQAALHSLRRRLGEPFATWDAAHLAKSLLAGLEGDVRVHDDTIVVTYYNAPNVRQLKEHYQELPDRLRSEKIAPEIPWLYGFKLDFRFR